MKIGIQHTPGSFSEEWINYCMKNHFDYKIVNCYGFDILEQLNDCDALMWHFSQNSSKDFLLAHQLIHAIEATGRKVFPDTRTSWHFDDKVGQKYLLESIGAPVPKTWVFYSRNDAERWISQAVFPVVFKLRNGAGSQNVQLVRTRKKALHIVRKAFGKGFPIYDSLGSLKERWRFYRLGKTNLRDIAEGIARIIIHPGFAKMQGHQKGYVYFQEFIAANDHDIRIIVIGGRAFAIKRMVRENDFRASGSGKILYDPDLIDTDSVRMAFGLAAKAGSQCIAFDFIYKDGKPLVVEISYGFNLEGYRACPGYWDEQLSWHRGKFNPCDWMVEDLVKSVSSTQTTIPGI